ncbi:MAG: 50S ribosomal protein L4 [Deltaproteobacteria bacterium]|nr:50S ribosomal protein L4 [Deltaproteobacteria bacterium]MBW1952795.1 50S ribosomal protein L4 [Deltaproteobacteria bacterium]MBW1987114.1 50S ribosomal protein L4 [Deltaproteobacteria bacterium]MBW2135404.1 50S ribosomal protein L4 [Deltaproteobacteria bacterium]
MAVVDVYDINRSKVGEVSLAETIFEVPIKSHLLHEVVTMQRACRRAGTASTKGRSDVRGGGRKPWRQKGTGRARAGTIRSPLWRGGGVVFGPQPRSYAFKVSKKVRRAALKMALSSKLKEGQLLVLEDYPYDTPKTRDFVKVMQNLQINKALFVTSDDHPALALSARNVPYVQVMRSEGLNVYDILCHDYLVLLKPAITRIEKSLTT